MFGDMKTNTHNWIHNTNSHTYTHTHTRTEWNISRWNCMKRRQIKKKPSRENHMEIRILKTCGCYINHWHSHSHCIWWWCCCCHRCRHRIWLSGNSWRFPALLAEFTTHTDPKIRPLFFIVGYTKTRSLSDAEKRKKERKKHPNRIHITSGLDFFFWNRRCLDDCCTTMISRYLRVRSFRSLSPTYRAPRKNVEDAYLKCLPIFEHTTFFSVCFSLPFSGCHAHEFSPLFWFWLHLSGTV